MRSDPHNQRRSEKSTSRISVIIPARNEADYLPQTLASLQNADRVEVIVVDGGSHDETPNIAEQAGCRVLHCSPGRALQMNMGAKRATGSIFLFLHADTQLPSDFEFVVRETLEQPKVVAGAFALQIDAPGWPFRMIERSVNFRSRWLQMPYGDQGLFLQKETFYKLGGFLEIPLLEDYRLVCQLRRHGKIKLVPSPVITSGRRWQQLGPWRTTWINQKIILGYHLGIPLKRLATWYRKVNGY